MARRLVRVFRLTDAERAVAASEGLSKREELVWNWPSVCDIHYARYVISFDAKSNLTDERYCS